MVGAGDAAEGAVDIPARSAAARVVTLACGPRAVCVARSIGLGADPAAGDLVALRPSGRTHPRIGSGHMRRGRRCPIANRLPAACRKCSSDGIGGWTRRYAGRGARRLVHADPRWPAVGRAVWRNGGRLAGPAQPASPPNRRGRALALVVAKGLAIRPERSGRRSGLRTGYHAARWAANPGQLRSGLQRIIFVDVLVDDLRAVLCAALRVGGRAGQRHHRRNGDTQRGNPAISPQRTPRRTGLRPGVWTDSRGDCRGISQCRRPAGFWTGLWREQRSAWWARVWRLCRAFTPRPAPGAVVEWRDAAPLRALPGLRGRADLPAQSRRWIHLCSPAADGTLRVARTRNNGIAQALDGSRRPWYDRIEPRRVFLRIALAGEAKRRRRHCGPGRCGDCIARGLRAPAPRVRRLAPA